MIELKSPQEIERMRQAGRVVAGLLEHLKSIIRPGMTTRQLDEAALKFIKQAGAKPAFLGYRGFPGTICVSINEEVVHGIPGLRRILEGDVVSMDAGAIVDGWYSDAAITVAIGQAPQSTVRLIETTKAAVEAGIAQMVVGNRVSDISHAVQSAIEPAGFGIVRDFVGHGIGRALHEDPPVPNFGEPGSGPRLKAGMVLAIEPMVTMGNFEVEVLGDGWTAVTKDRSLAAHFEHTVAITDNGAEVLTR